MMMKVLMDNDHNIITTSSLPGVTQGAPAIIIPNSSNSQVRQIIERSKKSSMFFIENFCKVKHPKAGIVPFKLFKYQRMSIVKFLSHKFNIYRKVRQCFIAGSMVWTPLGPRRIENIKVGDFIYSFMDGKLSSAEVTGAFVYEERSDLVEVMTYSGHCSVCTSDHLFLTTRGYIQAKDLTTSDNLVEFDILFNRQKGEVKHVKLLDRKEKVYDLTVPPADNFVVDGVVVHNSGISTLAGAFALWYAMLHPNKRVLIVSKRDNDSKEFLKKNVKFVYENLPKFWLELYGLPEPPIYNEHSVGFNNGSVIRSLTSSPATMRSESASLNIVDEAAFMPHMEEMWSGCAPSMAHGGGCIVISTSNGQGGWYHNTWTEAEQGRNEFNPIYVPWWEMDWTIRYKDDLTGKMEEIAPIRGIRETADKEEEDKYGKYWSPWLEEQYRLLQSKGEAHLFKQEILAEFIGTGNTVLSAEVLKYIGVTVSPKYWTVGKVNYLHPITEQNTVLDFDNQLRIWRKPVKPEPDIVEGGRIIRPGSSGHTYSIGMDISSGEADDYSAMVVVDCNTKEQVAELNIKILPADLIMMADYLGRWYNGAFIVPERTGLGIPVCQSLYNDIAYSNVFKMKTPAGKPGKKIGFPTSPAYKPQLNKNLLDYLGEDGVIIYSQRVFDQLCIYIHLGGGRTGHVDGPGNHSDLAIALALALVGITEAVQADQRSLIPSHNAPMEPADMSPDIVRKNTDQIKDLLSQGGVNALLPIVPGRSFDNGPIDALEEIMRFSQQMGGAVFDPKFGNSIFHRPKPVIIYRNRK
jgi:hypothetical protein